MPGPLAGADGKAGYEGEGRVAADREEKEERFVGVVAGCRENGRTVAAVEEVTVRYGWGL